MLNFPAKAYVGRNMPKEAFYKHLNLSSELKERFISAIKRISIEYKLSPATLNLEKNGETTEILVLSIELKKPALDYRLVESIARQNAHKLLFLLKFQEEAQLVLYYSKLYKTDWMPLSVLELEARGLNLDRIWEGFIEQIALQENMIPSYDDLTIDEKLKKQDAIMKLQKEIDKLERLSRREKQPKKRFELYTRLQGLKKKLAEEKGE
ncbi:MAG: DUF4391 domain-containing protein [Syntrophomonadaceae bacterium]